MAVLADSFDVRQSPEVGCDGWYVSRFRGAVMTHILAGPFEHEDDARRWAAEHDIPAPPIPDPSCRLLADIDDGDEFTRL